jgi:hypothetical protein
MIKHIVLWKVKEEADGLDRAGLAARIKADLEALAPVIPEIRSIEVGINELPGEQAADLALVAEFDDLDALDAYQRHPAHQQVVAFVRRAVTSRQVVDYTT